MLGQSEPMLRVFEQIRRAARSDSTVIVVGESGTGKELVAEALHRLGHRARGPFVDVNTTAIPETLVESELFGHVRGAFTGAITDRMGRFEAADGGVLFIDEIGDFPLASQAKLLRVLETRRITPVGAVQDRCVDVRVVAATHRCLEQMVADGSFRRDLYYRLNVVTISLPPLSARGSDIRLLIDHFVRKICNDLDRPPPDLDDELIEYLTGYSWPGNVRQLSNCLESMLVMSPGPRLTLADLPQRIFFQPPARPIVRVPAGTTLAELERQAIQQTLATCEGDRSQAAQTLGISLRTLQRKLKLWSRPDAG